MEGFEQIGETECWEKHGWGCEARKDSTVDYGVFEVFIDELNENYDDDGKPVFACEIFASNGDMVGQWFDSSREVAAFGAWLQVIGAEIERS